MAIKLEYNYLEKYLNEIQADGKVYFNLKDLKKKFPNNSINSIQMNLKRMNNKGKIKYVQKGFYIIIPPEYSKQNVIPPELFIDALLRYLDRKYYVSLLSAAVFHGASHQQPQEYFVMIEKPAIRYTKVDNLKINYIVNSDLENSIIEDKKTRTGYIKVSNPEQTAVDLIKFQNNIGGLNRVATVLFELVESMDAGRLKKVIRSGGPNAVFQRLGYILEKKINREDMAEAVSDSLGGLKLFRVPLKPGIDEKGKDIDHKWKIIENFNIEVDF